MADIIQRQKWNRFDITAALAGLAFLFWLTTPHLFPASQFYTLHEVRVSDSYVKRTIPLHFERTLWKETEHAFYEVDIISSDTGRRQCYGKRHVPYAESVNLILGVRGAADETVRWWAYSNDGDCEKWTPERGKYFIKTRHCWKRFGWTRTACNPWHTSNVFTLY